MPESRIDGQKIRNALKTKRNLLFADFTRNPSNMRLALEIRLLDDRIADLDTGQVRASLVTGFGTGLQPARPAQSIEGLSGWGWESQRRF